MSEYRTISDGYCDWLQYKEVTFGGWWIFKKIKVVWRYVRSDYYDYFDERWEKLENKFGNSSKIRDEYRYINSYNTNINNFVKKYPVVESWLIERARVVKEKREAAHASHQRIALKIGSTKYFNQ